MKTSLKILLVTLLFLGLFSCNDIEEPPVQVQGITIEGAPGDTTIVENTTLILNITVTANEGLTDFEIDGSEYPVSGLQTFTTTLEFEASLYDPWEDVYLNEKKFYVSLYARDSRGSVLQIQFQVTVIPLSKWAEENSESLVPIIYYDYSECCRCP